MAALFQAFSSHECGCGLLPPNSRRRTALDPQPSVENVGSQAAQFDLWRDKCCSDLDYF